MSEELAKVDIVMLSKIEADQYHTLYSWDTENKEGIQPATAGITIPVTVSDLRIGLLAFAVERRFAIVDFRGRVYEGHEGEFLDSIDRESIVIKVTDGDIEWTACMNELSQKQADRIVEAIEAEGDWIASECLSGYSPCAREFKKYVEDCAADCI